MLNILRWFLPLALPPLVRWAERLEEDVCRTGQALDEDELVLAREAGVQCPDRIRVAVRERIPLPASRLLRAMAKAAQLSFEPAGLSLGYAILVRTREGRNSRLLTHEFVHTAQYERMGGMGPYLQQYLRECLRYGYRDAPMEEEAILRTGRIFGWDS